MPKEIKILTPKNSSKEISQHARLKAIVERALRRIDERTQEIMERHRWRLKQQLTNQAKSDNKRATPIMTRARNDPKPSGFSARGVG